MQPQNTPNDNSSNAANGLTPEPTPISPQPLTPPSPQPTPPPAWSNGAPMVVNPTVVNPGAAPDDVLATQAMVNQPMAGQSSTSPWPKRRNAKAKRLFIPILLATLLVGGSAAAYFGYVVPNKPESLWAAALQNTGRGYHQLEAYQEDHKSDKGADIKGTYSLDGATKSDGKFESSWYDGVGYLKLDVGLLATRATLEGRALKSASKNPDLYVNLAGIKGLGNLAGSPQTEKMISKIDGQWIMIDHTLIDNIEKQMQQLSSTTNTSLTPADTQQIFKKVGEALDAHVFTPDQSAFVIKQKIGKETRDGRSVYHYKATVDKQQLKELVTTLKDKLNETKVKQLAGDKSLDEVMEIDELKKEIDKIDTNKAVADVWVDTHTRVFQAVRINMTENSSNEYVEFGTPYTGGDSMPFVIKMSSKDVNGSLKLDLNPKTSKSKVTIDVKAQDQVTFNLAMDINSRNSAVDVQKPATSKSLAEVIGVDINKLLQELGGNSTPAKRGSSSSSNPNLRNLLFQ